MGPLMFRKELQVLVCTEDRHGRAGVTQRVGQHSWRERMGEVLGWDSS